MSNFFGKEIRKEFKGYYYGFPELLEFCKNIIAEHIDDEKFLKLKQISIQTNNDVNNDSYVSTGYPLQNLEAEIPDNPHYEKTFAYIQPRFAGTIIEDYLKWLEVPVYRTRIMMMTPGSCYNIHGDHSTRLHLPLITDEQALFLFVNKPITLFHLPADGKTTWVDTRRTHTFLNCSDQKRFHLVMVTGEY